MIIKNLFISLFLGLIYLFVSTSALPTSNFWVQYLLLLLVPLPMFLVIFSFSFWISIVAFLPIIIFMFFNLSYAVNINILLTVPLLIIFIFINLKSHKAGRYIPLIIVGYSILLFLGIHYYFNLHSLSLPDSILDTINVALFHINSSNPDLFSTDKSIYVVNTFAFLLPTTFAFLLPTIITLVFYFIMISNYVIANTLVNKNSFKFNNLQIGTLLPGFYIYIFIIYLIAVLIAHYLLKINFSTMYVVYNIAIILIIPFMVSGLGVINKNNFFLFSFIILLLLLSSYIIIIICLIGFLKEVKEIKFFNIKYLK